MLLPNHILHHRYVFLFLSAFFNFRISRHDRIIIMSIHQPRYSIFKLFDSVTLLSKGEVVYSGLARAVVPYFSSVLGKGKHLINSLCVQCTEQEHG